MQYGRSRSGRMVTGICTAALVLSLGMPHAQAATSGAVRARAAKENERLEELVTLLEKGRKEVDGLDKEIKKLAKQSVEMQSELIEDRGELRTMVSTSYRWGHAPSVWDIALSSETLDDFVSKLYYANKVTEWQTNCVQQLDEDKRELDDHMNQIEETRNERKEKLVQLEDTCEKVAASVDTLMEMAEGLEEQERAAEEARLGEIAQQAANQSEFAQQWQTQAQATANARALAATAATNPEQLEARAEADDAYVVALKTAIDQGEDPQEAAQRIAAEVAASQARDGQADGGEAQDGAADKSKAEAAAGEAAAGDVADGAAAGKEADDKATVDADAAADEAAGGKPADAADAATDEAAGSKPAVTDEARVEDIAQELLEEATRADEAAPEGGEARGEEAPPETPAEDAAPEPAADDGGDWINCIASAYTIADNWPPGSTATASGIPLDESVPTVALPISADPAQYYGSQVQIEYGDTTVIATVTDCGGMGGGSRGLDLTPAVFEALGAESGDDWGLREVRYRFI